MAGVQIYKYKDFMPEDFPFKIEIRNRDNLPKIRHTHDSLQICYVRRGTCYHSVNDMQTSLVKGDTFAIPPLIEHILLPKENMEVEIIQIDFMPYLINESMRDLSSMEGFVDFAYIQPMMSLNDSLSARLNLSPANQIRVEELIGDMQMEVSAKDEGYRLSIKADLLKLLVIVGREFRNLIGKREVNQVIKSHHKAFQDAIEYIKTHYKEEIKLEEAAAKAYMSPAYFSHVFKLVKGKTFIEYLNYIRIHQAISCLQNQEMSITEICFASGFNNVGHFNRTFRNVTGNTPSQYRKQTAISKNK